MALCSAQHAAYVVQLSERRDTIEHAASEHLRMSGIYWGATALALLGRLDALPKDQIVAFVHACKTPAGGYAPAVGHDAHILYTLSAVQILALFDELDRVDVDAVVRYLVQLQRPDGSFAGDEWGEVDTRFSYCALSCASLLGRMADINVDSAVAYVRSCENFDGGYGCEPGGESHAGQIFTCVGALAIAGALGQPAAASASRFSGGEALAFWLAERQTPGGGLNGRPQKDADVCYSWWVLSSLTLLGKVHWIDAEALRAFILRCQDEEHGGISDKPGDEPDVFHTFFGIAGLSLLGTDGVPPMDAAFALPETTMASVRDWQARQRQVPAPAAPRKPGVATPDELAALVAAAGPALIVVDVRDPTPGAEPSASAAPVANGLRPRAVNIVFDRQAGTMDLSLLPPDWIESGGGKERVGVITHCGGGGRGGKAKAFLEAHGFGNVLNGGGPEDADCWKVFGHL